MAKGVIHKRVGGSTYADDGWLRFYTYCGIAAQRTSIRWRHVTCRLCLRLQAEKGRAVKEK